MLVRIIIGYLALFEIPPGAMRSLPTFPGRGSIMMVRIQIVSGACLAKYSCRSSGPRFHIVLSYGRHTCLPPSSTGCAPRPTIQCRLQVSRSSDGQSPCTIAAAHNFEPASAPRLRGGLLTCRRPRRDGGMYLSDRCSSTVHYGVRGSRSMAVLVVSAARVRPLAPPAI